MKRKKTKIEGVVLCTVLLSGLFIYNGCTTSSGNASGEMPVPAVPVLTVTPESITTHEEYPAVIEGKQDIGIRPQVAGYLEHIAVDEGDYVKKGQPLFRIDARPFKESLLTAKASLLSAQAELRKATIEVERLRPLVEKNVVSSIQLQSAEADLARASASVAQGEANVRNAEINLGYTTISSPVNGYVGRIPMKAGSLVGSTESAPLTTVSDIRDVYAYFNMSENDFLQFSQTTKGITITEKLRNLPPVELVLADNSVYPQHGKIETVEGQFDSNTGSIRFRALFPNPDLSLRSGTSGRVRISSSHDNVLAIPKRSTFEIQDKILVFVVNDSNKVTSRPILVREQTSDDYILSDGIKAGERIVLSGMDRLRDGVMIKPEVRK